MSSRPSGDPQRGEIWWVSFDPSTGQEIQKTRPAVVITAPGMGRHSLKIVVPLIGWKPSHTKTIWMLRLSPSPANGLTKESGADASQVKSVSTARFNEKIGEVTADELEDIVAAVALVIGYTP
ncbi:MAG: type II toxin-antitoxin system PemK/MazF family toxin [Chloroflexi bacterium]|nr:type II toxin-antitoxin system PemK/MazF family toxin [Chloroflexota bacterium]